MSHKDEKFKSEVASIVEAIGRLIETDPAGEAVEDAVEDAAEDDAAVAAADDDEGEAAGGEEEGRILDLSVLVSPNWPSTWPVLPPLIVKRYLSHGPGPYASEAMVIDEHTGTHFDAPNHFIPPLDTGLPNASLVGDVPSDQLPIWQFVGEACVIDVQDLLVGAAPGATPLITADRVEAWETANRVLGPGDVVFFYSGYSDQFYRPLPGGRRYSADPLQGSASAWSGIDPACIDYLVGRQIEWVGIDAPNIGPASPVAIVTHLHGLGNGLIYTENLVNLGSLPATGALVAVLGAKHAAGSGGESRVVAVADPEAAAPLLRAVRRRQVVDLSVLLREDLPVWWPGAGVGNSRMPYMGRDLHRWDQPGGPAFVRSHIMDCQTGTHLVPPAYAMPSPGFDRRRYDSATRKSLERFEKRHGRLGTSTMTADRVPVSWLCGPARVIDVTHRLGTAPGMGSPVIVPADVDRHEDRFGPIAAGEIVIFHSGHSDRLFQPFPQGNACIADPIAGQAEGWPAPSAKTILHLAKKGVRCIGTDGPRMGAVDPEAALATYWAGGSRGVCFVEYLINAGTLPPVGAFFLFAPVKVEGSHGGHGRALAIF
ncbi:MAG TPA: cyclase family protein [Thermoanaerobaculia bacterium]|jgi:kynurenine formamidase|nr:cyclase family protein [Thermoanaerobaculia bacterium]